MSKPNAPIILLRGLTREQRHWGEFVPLLQQQLPDTAIYTPDIPGNGSLFLSSSPTTISGMTAALRQQRQAYGPTTGVHLVALSMGGMIALDWMTRYPQEIHSAVLINCSLRGLAPFYRRLRWQNYLRLLRLCLQAGAQREQTLLQLTANLRATDTDTLHHWQQWQKQYPVSLRNTLRQLLAAARFRPTAAPIKPLLILAAQQDRLVDYRCSLRLQQTWQAPLHLHPSAGHDLALDDPHWLSQEIQTWLASLLHATLEQH